MPPWIMTTYQWRKCPAGTCDATANITNGGHYSGATSPSLVDIRLYEEIRHYGARNQDVEDILRTVEAESLAMLLKMADCEVRTVYDGRAALRAR